MPSINDILKLELKVLDDGFIRVVDVMGGDGAIVQAARISYGKGTKRISKDRGLIRYLLRHKHTTPFEMCEIKLHVRAPMDCWRQWIRHRTANVNEYSTRYSEAIDAAQETSPSAWRLQAKSNKQGSEKFVPLTIGTELSQQENEILKQLRTVYEGRLAKGVAREQARKDLSLSTYTEAYWKIDLHNLLHFLSLRMDAHAQFEIRQYATAIGEQIVAKWCPYTWEAFQDYEINSLRLSRLEIDVMKCLASADPAGGKKVAEDFGWLKRNKSNDLVTNRERFEFESKLSRLGIRLPW